MHLFYINRNHTCSLRSIDDQKQPMPPCHLSHPRHVRQVSGQIRCMGADDRFRVCPDGCFDRIKICRSVLSTRRNRKFNTLFLHGIERTQHRIMLQLRRDHMISRKKHPLDCHIQSFRCIGRKNQPRWITASEKIAERLPRLIDHSRCSKCRTGKPRPEFPKVFMASRTAHKLPAVFEALSLRCPDKSCCHPHTFCKTYCIIFTAADGSFRHPQRFL